MMYTVYRISCKASNRKYFGITASWKRRHRDHFRMLQDGKHYNQDMQSDYTAHSRDFSSVVLADNLTLDRACELERKLIASSENPYNMSTGGEVGGRKKPTMWDGILYPTISAAAEAAGVLESEMSMYRKYGVTSSPYTEIANEGVILNR